MKIALCVSIGIIALSLAACSQGDEEKTPTKATSKAKLRDGAKAKIKFHADMETPTSAVSGTPILQSLKNNHLEVSSTKTIGEAFDGYKFAIKKEWREAPAQNGPYYIDYICWFKIGPVSGTALTEGVVKRGLNIKFAIQEDGETYIAMASRVDTKTDGMVHTTVIEPADIKKIITAIYENRELTF